MVIFVGAGGLFISRREWLESAVREFLVSLLLTVTSILIIIVFLVVWTVFVMLSELRDWFAK